MTACATIGATIRSTPKATARAAPSSSRVWRSATARRCVREKTPQKLEPMLPSERKIVHLALADSELVRTESEGEEPERRVVIFPR